MPLLCHFDWVTGYVHFWLRNHDNKILLLFIWLLRNETVIFLSQNGGGITILTWLGLSNKTRITIWGLWTLWPAIVTTRRFPASSGIIDCHNSRGVPSVWTFAPDPRVKKNSLVHPSLSFLSGMQMIGIDTPRYFTALAEMTFKVSWHM